MLYILETVNSMDSFCKSLILFRILDVVRKGLTLIQIFGPIITMVALVVNFIRLTLNPEEKKYKQGVKNSLIATVILFMLPAIINLVMTLPGIESKTTFGQCWKSVENTGKVVKNKTK